MTNAEPSPDEKAALVAKLRDRAAHGFSLSRKQREYCTDVALDIHLRARKWDLDKAFSILSESLRWVEEHEDLLTHLECPQCIVDPSQHYYQSLGHDKLGRPVIYTTAGCHWKITIDHCFEHNIIAFENAVKSMPPGVETFIYIADMYNASLANIDLKTNIAFFRTIQAPYRGRLGHILLVDPPPAIWFGLKLIKPFLKPETLEKVIFVKTSEMATVLSPVLGEAMTRTIIAEVTENHDKARALKKKWW